VIVVTEGTSGPSTFAVNNFPPIFNNDRRKLVHPALDFTEDTAYVGLALQHKNPNGLKKQRLYLVTETEIFEASTEELEKRKIELSHPSLPKQNKSWSNEGVKKHINDKDYAGLEDLFKLLKTQLLKYIDFKDKRCYDLVALYNIGTYFFPLFDAYAYLHINGLTDSGKTQLLKVCENIAFNAELHGNISSASLFRLVEASRCTLLIDENEEMANPQKGEEFRKLLLNGYKKGGKVTRSDMSSRSYDPTSFEVYSPKIIASIAVPDNVLGSRCIEIVMQPTSNKELAGKVVKDGPEWQEIRDLLYAFLFRKWRKVRESFETLENQGDLSNRDWELWRPILAIARVVSGETYDGMLALGHEKAEQRKVDHYFTEEYTLAEVLNEIVVTDDYYWLGYIKENIEAKREYKVPSWLTERGISNLLKKFGFQKTKRDNKGVKYYLTVTAVKDIARRFGIINDDSVHSVGPTEGKQ
jgi:hypothetical protein